MNYEKCIVICIMYIVSTNVSKLSKETQLTILHFEINSLKYSSEISTVKELSPYSAFETRPCESFSLPPFIFFHKNQLKIKLNILISVDTINFSTSQYFHQWNIL